MKIEYTEEEKKLLDTIPKKRPSGNKTNRRQYVAPKYHAEEDAPLW